MKHLVPLLTPFVALGCLDSDDLVFDTDLEETTQEVSGTLVNTYTCSSSCSFFLGMTTSEGVCFLGGVRGRVGADPHFSAHVLANSSGHYQLRLDSYATSGQTITATTVCVSPAANVRLGEWSTYDGVPSIQIPNTTASSKCFLAGFTADGAMTSYNDSVRTWRSASGTWFLGGSAASGNGYLSARAVCFDASDRGTWSWGQGSSGTTTGNLASNSTGGVACGLTELGGNYTTGSGSDGVHVGYNSATARWVWTFKNFKHAHAACIK